MKRSKWIWSMAALLALTTLAHAEDPLPEPIPTPLPTPVPTPVPPPSPVPSPSPSPSPTVPEPIAPSPSPSVPVPAPVPAPATVPAPAPSPSPSPAPAPATELSMSTQTPGITHKMSAGGHFVIAVPRGGLGAATRTSSGIRGFFQYALRPAVVLIGSIEYLRFLNQPTTPAEAAIDTYALDVGARVKNPLAGTTSFFLEGQIGLHGLAASGVKPDPSATGIGFRVGAGVEMAITERLIASGSISYSTASVEANGIADNIEFIPCELGVSYRF